MVEKLIFLLDIPGLGLAAFPTIPPIANQEFKTKGINLHAGLEADAKVAEVHLVLVGVCQEKTEVTCDGKEEIVIEG